MTKKTRNKMVQPRLDELPGDGSREFGPGCDRCVGSDLDAWLLSAHRGEA